MAKKETKTNAMRILEKTGVSYQVKTYECSEFLDGIHVADLLNLSYEEIYKTLVTVGKTKEYYVFVIPVSADIDLKKAAKTVGEKALEMLPLKDLTIVTGYIRGGCTAIGMKKNYVTVIQEDAKALTHIHVSGGKPGMQICLSPQDLKDTANAIFSDVIHS